MSAAPSAHATILDFFIPCSCQVPEFISTASRHRNRVRIPPRSGVSEQNRSLWTDGSDRYQLAI